SYAYLIVFGHMPGHDELNHPSYVALNRHGCAQGFHGVLVGHTMQRLPIDCNELVIDS
ncbi:hypothetical protein NQZ68_016216, partial [Dissostichus eleginoides]